MSAEYVDVVMCVPLRHRSELGLTVSPRMMASMICAMPKVGTAHDVYACAFRALQREREDRTARATRQLMRRWSLSR